MGAPGLLRTLMSEMTRSGNRHRVLIAGGGVAALETLLALRALAGHQLELALLSPDWHFIYQPVTVGEAFGEAEARRYPVGAVAAEQGAELVPEALVSVDVAGRSVLTDFGTRIEFDKLVIATGAIQREPLPGALTFRGRNDVAALRRLLEELVDGDARSVALALPSEDVWPLPLYELALMTADYVREHDGRDLAVSLVTPEERPLELLGDLAGDAVAALLAARNIVVRPSSSPVAVRPHALVLADGGVVLADRVITLPVLEGPALAGLPRDPRGFIPVDEHGRVRGQADVFAAGDVISFPVKQGGLAAQQADAVAETIASEIGVAVRPQPFRPVLRGLLMTGGAPLYLRADARRPTRDAPVALEAAPPRREDPDAAVSGQPLWWPPVKIAGRYLAPYLATAHPQPLADEVLADRVPVPGPAASEAEFADALELALMMADLDAKWGDYRSALAALDAAEAVKGALPPKYEARRREWRAAEWASNS
jgi:sulfide:quinone oxidoreductase